VPQFALIRELVDAMGVRQLEVPGYEADDLLATLADAALARDRDVVIVTGDKDLMQLVAPRVSLFDPMKDKHFGRDEVIERFGVPPELVADVLALCGDATDNIPGVPKVGEKTAAKLVSAYGDVEHVIAALSEPGRKLKAAELSVVEHADDARLSKRLAVLNHEVPIGLDLDALHYSPPQAEKLAPFLRRIEAVGLLRELGMSNVETPWGPEPSGARPLAPSGVAGGAAAGITTGGAGSAGGTVGGGERPGGTLSGGDRIGATLAGAEGTGATLPGADRTGATLPDAERTAGTHPGAERTAATHPGAERTAPRPAADGTVPHSAADRTAGTQAAEAEPEGDVAAADAPAVLTVAPAGVPLLAPEVADVAASGQQVLRFEPRPVQVTPTPVPADVSRDLAPIDRSVYRAVYDCQELAALVAAARKCGELAIGLETSGTDANRAEIIGIALAAADVPPVYVPVRHRYLGVPRQVACDAALDFLRPLLEDPAVKKVGHDLKPALLVLARAGVELRGIGADSHIAAYVLDPGRPSFGLDAVAREALGHETQHRSEVIGRGKAIVGFDEVTVETATRYAAERADVALRLCHVLSRKVDDLGLGRLYRELELPLMPVLASMERAGVRVEPKRLEELGREFAERLAIIEARAEAVVGGKVNLASPKQLSELLFDKLGLKSEKKTKTGFSTDSDVLEVLAREHEVPRIILEHRMLSKLKSTYVDILARMRNPDTGRVHTSYNQTGAATGRLSSIDPNLQNIPVRSPDGRRIRAAFVAAPGHVLISADYSQIELRVMAHLSGDESFIEAFHRGEDIHQRTAQEVLTGGAPVDAEARRRAKAINFGILYGLSEFGLSRQLEIPRAESGAYIKAYFARYPRIRGFLDATVEGARVRGYVSTLAGRRRYLPEINSKNRNVRQGAERVAMNTPIQGSAADLIKLAMLRVDALIRERRLETRLLLQVHDELVLEAPEGEREAVVELVRGAMAGVAELRVPLVVDVGVGTDWATAH
jgi:DNA polymerase I-like protein with 3'-5' exonuclease and polymerase domains